MFNSLKIVVASVLSAAALTVVSSPAEAATSCYGSKYYVTCTSSEYDYRSGKMIYCNGSGTPGYVTWTCNSY